MNFLKNLIVGKYGKSAIRHVMTLLAGWLLSIGVPPETVQTFTGSGESIFIAIFLYFLAQGWSWNEKKD